MRISNAQKLKVKNYCFDSLAIRLRSKDLNCHLQVVSHGTIAYMGTKLIFGLQIQEQSLSC